MKEPVRDLFQKVKVKKVIAANNFKKATNKTKAYKKEKRKRKQVKYGGIVNKLSYLW